MQQQSEQVLDVTLLNACVNGRIEIAEFLIKKGADIEAVDKDDSTSLVIACENGHIDIVKLLLKNGADINGATLRATPLAAACYNRHIEIVKLLIDRGADINQKDQVDQTLIQSACWADDKDLIEFMLDMGADVNYVDSPEDWTLLRISSDNKAIVKLLLDRGADTNGLDIEGRDDDGGVLFISLRSAVRILKNKVLVESEEAPVITEGYKDLFKLIFQTYIKQHGFEGSYSDLTGRIQGPTEIDSEIKGALISFIPDSLKIWAVENLKKSLGNPDTLTAFQTKIGQMALPANILLGVRDITTYELNINGIKYILSFNSKALVDATESPSFNNLPKESWSNIASFLPDEDVVNLGTCSRVFTIIDLHEINKNFISVSGQKYPFSLDISGGKFLVNVSMPEQQGAEGSKEPLAKKARTEDVEKAGTVMVNGSEEGALGTEESKSSEPGERGVGVAGTPIGNEGGASTSELGAEAGSVPAEGHVQDQIDLTGGIEVGADAGVDV